MQREAGAGNSSWATRWKSWHKDPGVQKLSRAGCRTDSLRHVLAMRAPWSKEPGAHTSADCAANVTAGMHARGVNPRLARVDALSVLLHEDRALLQDFVDVAGLGSTFRDTCREAVPDQLADKGSVAQTSTSIQPHLPSFVHKSHLSPVYSLHSLLPSSLLLSHFLAWGSSTPPGCSWPNSSIRSQEKVKTGGGGCKPPSEPFLYPPLAEPLHY